MSSTASTFAKIAKIGGGGIVFLFSAPCVAMILIEMITLQIDDLAASVAVLVMFGFAAAMGVWAMYSGFQQSKEPDFEITQDVEREVLQLANYEGGKLSSGKIAVSTDLSVDEAEEVLESFAMKGVAHTDISDGGSIQYIFPGFGAEKEPDSLALEINEAIEQAPTAKYQAVRADSQDTDADQVVLDTPTDEYHSVKEEAPESESAEVAEAVEEEVN